ncbi:unnamed protein product [Ceutorhynchus assimilis]|uniref:Uncharacterized protein n=1 Tax=Ceutorhynchus assimilis TaxID=467358 RepID=A0A9N9MRA6_9CUCU|nr:unnamed protein product [Ceutorhynchus assimilis]
MPSKTTKRITTNTRLYRTSDTPGKIDQRSPSNVKPMQKPNEVDKVSKIASPRTEILSSQCNPKREIKRSKYERDDAAIFDWWQNLFDKLEHDANIPPEEQRDVLSNVFGLSALRKILYSCNTRNPKFKEELDTLSDKDISQMRMKVRERLKTDSFFTNKQIVLTNETRQSSGERSAKNIRTSATKAPVEVSKCKMYMDFFKRKPDRAAVWRNLPPLSLSEMTLTQRAKTVTEQIATDFVNWLRDLGGDEEVSLSVGAIIEMFEIGFQANSTRSLRVGIQEIPSVSKRVAITKKCPEKARRSVLRQEIMKDLRASKKKTIYSAFGGRLPAEMQGRPPAENYFKKWMTCDRVPERLTSMATVWQGITHLKSTRAYCEFLLEQPDVKPPKYLLECGMMDLRKLRDENRKSSDIFDIDIS